LWNHRFKRQIRERRRAEEIVAAKEAELHDMFERSPVSVVITRMDGTFLYANPSWLTLLQMTKEELFQRRAQDNYVDFADREKVIQLLEENGSVRDVEVRYKRSDGQTIWTLLSADVRQYQKETSLISWFVDITERKAADKIIKEAKKNCVILQTVSRAPFFNCVSPPTAVAPTPS
jgi:PAS domain S-box-containing protein